MNFVTGMSVRYDVEPNQSGIGVIIEVDSENHCFLVLDETINKRLWTNEYEIAPLDAKSRFIA